MSDQLQTSGNRIVALEEERAGLVNQLNQVGQHGHQLARRIDETNERLEEQQQQPRVDIESEAITLHSFFENNNIESFANKVNIHGPEIFLTRIPSRDKTLFCNS